MIKSCLFIFCFFSSLIVFSQNRFSGRVVDSKTNESLAFVNIIYNSNNYGTTTDLDGYFSIDSFDKIEFIKISYLGYSNKIITKDEIRGKNYLEIKLESKAYELAEVIVLPGINPAHRIIDEVIKNSDKNNPEKMRSFSYVSYNRMHFTIDTEKREKDLKNDTLEIRDSADSPNMKIGIGINPGKNDDEYEPKNDTLESQDTLKDMKRKLFDFFDSQHIFLMESVTERKFRYPDNNKEEVLAQRMSGMKNPSFVLLTSQMQSISFYKDYITLLDKKYLSPISKGSTKRYLFQIEDTMYNENSDTIFVISYRPLRNKNFVGMQGVLHINSNGYAIQNVSAKPYETTAFDINIQQKYELIEGIQWFPVQLNTDIVMKMIVFATDSTSSHAVGIGKTYISDISLNPDHKRREFNQLSVTVKPDANRRKEDFWENYRNEPLSEKDLKTYKVIDSVGEELKIDKVIRFADLLSSGYWSIRYINLDLKSIYWYDKYQGSRLGLGLYTNDNVSQWFNIGGYFAYGFKDKAWKYGGKLDFLLHKPSDTRIKFGYSRDLEMSDDYTFQKVANLQVLNSVMTMFMDEMDSVTNYYTSFQFPIVRYLMANVKFSYSDKNIINTNRYNYLHPIEKHYFNTELGIYLRYAFKEKFIQTPRGNRISLGTKYPILNFNIIKGLNLFESTSDYLKLEASVYKKFTIRNAGETSITATGAMIEGIAPYSELYYITGIKSWLSFDNVFNTMKINEFISDRFATIFIKHDFGSLLFKTKKFEPHLVLVTAAGWGDAKLIGNAENEDHAKLMNKGYFESGIQINNILKLNNFFGYGLGVYYRYGSYSLPKEIDNWAFKLSLTLKL